MYAKVYEWSYNSTIDGLLKVFKMAFCTVILKLL